MLTITEAIHIPTFRMKSPGQDWPLSAPAAALSHANRRSSFYWAPLPWAEWGLAWFSSCPSVWAWHSY